ncbi:MAG TPA: MauE/DoxX family redox-associated membrane protein [Kofleriaceae bacterium]|nr:MauE/DoxX family redox-associated membrane protein [Kofleriaceae bacterium]
MDNDSASQSGYADGLDRASQDGSGGLCGIVLLRTAPQDELQPHAVRGLHPPVLAGGLLARATLGWIFGAALLSKTAGRARWHAFADALPALGLPARVPAGMAAALVIAGEACALALLLYAPRVGAALSAAMLAMFTVALAAAVRGNRRAACHCFGGSDAVVGRAHVVRNVLLLAIAGAWIATGASSAVELSATDITALGYGALLGFLFTRWDDLAFLAGIDLQPAEQRR